MSKVKGSELIFKTTEFDYPILVRVTRRKVHNTYTVGYGEQVKGGLTRGEAARELGYVLFHALALRGKLDLA